MYILKLHSFLALFYTSAGSLTNKNINDKQMRVNCRKDFDEIAGLFFSPALIRSYFWDIQPNWNVVCECIIQQEFMENNMQHDVCVYVMCVE